MKNKILFSTVFVLLAGVLLTLVPVHAQSPQNSNGLAFTPMPCPDGVFPPTADVDCGYVTVPERRRFPNGKTIQVAAAIVHAAAVNPKPDPIVFIDGGPSFGAISSFALDSYFADADYIQDRDLILVDTRGTGLSQPRLGCPELDQASQASFYSSPYVDSSFGPEMRHAVQDCHDRLSADGIHLAAYNSGKSARDLDALRHALGYEKWNMLAISADGVLGSTYMRLYPDHLRSVILDAGASLQHHWNVDYLRGQNEQLDQIFAGCRANAACKAKYPRLHRVFKHLVSELQANPVDVSVPNMPGGPVTFHVDGVEFYFNVLGWIFPGDADFPETIHDTLDKIWRAAHGEFDEVMQEFYDFDPFFDRDLFYADGKTMSYTCRDLIPFQKRRDFRRAAREIPELKPFFLDAVAGLPFNPAGCEIWGVGQASKSQRKPLVSSLPTLVLAGEYDTSVPPLIVRQIPATLSNSHYYEIPASAHLTLAVYNNGSACVRSIAAQFLDHPDQEPNSDCINSLEPFDFTPPESLSTQAPRFPPQGLGVGRQRNRAHLPFRSGVLR